MDSSNRPSSPLSLTKARTHLTNTDTGAKMVCLLSHHLGNLDFAALQASPNSGFQHPTDGFTILYLKRILASDPEVGLVAPEGNSVAMYGIAKIRFVIIATKDFGAPPQSACKIEGKIYLDYDDVTCMDSLTIVTTAPMAFWGMYHMGLHLPMNPSNTSLQMFVKQLQRSIKTQFDSHGKQRDQAEKERVFHELVAAGL